jgi:hypothetical protein
MVQMNQRRFSSTGRGAAFNHRRPGGGAGTRRDARRQYSAKPFALHKFMANAPAIRWNRDLEELI